MAVEAVFFDNAVIAELGTDGDFFVCGIRSVGRCGRGHRRDLVDVRNFEARDFGDIARFVRTAEVDRAVFGKLNASGVGNPIRAIQAVLVENRVFIEDRTDVDSGIRRDSNINRGNRLIRRDFVDIADGIGRGLGDVARGVLATEEDGAILHELNRGGVRLPVFAVKAVFLNDGIRAERSRNQYIRVGRDRNVRGGHRSFRSNLVDVAHEEIRYLGDVSSLIRATE